MNNEIEAGGHTYRVGKLDAMRQFHVTRRLLPILTTLGLTADKLKGVAADVAKDDALLLVAGPVADIIAKMPNEDVDYVIQTCLSVVRRKDGERWAPVLAGVHFQYQDITMPTMVKLTIEVVRENMGGFFGGPVEETPSM